MLSISAVKLGNIAQKTITFKIYTTDVRNMFHLRSEEHTSELQSHVRISYAVFCLKKKKKNKKKKKKKNKNKKKKQKKAKKTSR